MEMPVGQQLFSYEIATYEKTLREDVHSREAVFRFRRCQNVNYINLVC